MIYDLTNDTYILTNITKDKLLSFTKNKELRFLKYNSNNFYKLLLKSYDAGYLIKMHNWDYSNLKEEYSISKKISSIINFNKYICYFEYEDNFINYINDKETNDIYSNIVTDEKSIVFMHNYFLYKSEYIDSKYIQNIYTQFILALYSCYYTYNIYFNEIDNDFICLIKNKAKKKYRYYIKDKKIYLNNCDYKLIISDISKFNTEKIVDIDNNILNIISNFKIFNKNFEFTKKDLNNIKKKYNIC